MNLLTLALLVAVCGALAWALRPLPKPKHRRHRWIEREINYVIRRSS